jgi:hypothetical protein
MVKRSLKGRYFFSKNLLGNGVIFIGEWLCGYWAMDFFYWRMDYWINHLIGFFKEITTH